MNIISSQRWPGGIAPARPRTTVQPATFHHYLSAFIDILGFTPKIAQAGSSVEKLTKIADSVRTIQEEFEHNPADDLTKGAHEALNKEVLAFSDCVLIGTDLGSSTADVMGGLDLILAELNSFGIAQACCVVKNIFLRGGVDMGLWSYRQDRLVSPAAIRAYEWERDVTNPVIGLSVSLAMHLHQHEDRRHYNRKADNTFEILACQDQWEPHYWYIDYARIYLSLLRAELEPENFVRDWQARHKLAIETGYQTASDERTRDKYRWLAEYHNQSVKTYGIDETGYQIILR